MLPRGRPTGSLVRGTMLAIACGTLAWGFWLLAFGGFDTAFLGLRVRSNNPRRVLLIALLALAGFFLAGGAIPASRAAIRSWATSLSRRPFWLALVIAVCSVTAAIAGSTRIAGGSDAYGYVSQADLWLSGNVKVQQPSVEHVPWPDAMWTFTPLGYRPVGHAGDWSIVPTYSPGLPLLLAGAKLIGGQCAMFALVPLLTGVTVLATYGLGRRLQSPQSGLIAAWLVATSPVILGSLEPLTDVPVMAAWTIAYYFALGSAVPSAVAAGSFAGLAILIRPNLFPLAAPLGMWLLVRRDLAGRDLRSRLISASVFAVGVLMGIGAVALINQHLYGSATTSGYGRLEDQFAWIRVAPNLRRYLSWFVGVQTPVALVGFLALFVPAKRLWPAVQDRTVILLMALYVVLLWGMYSAYLEFDSWGYLRFLLPSWPLLMLGVAAVFLAAARAGGSRGRWVMPIAVVALGAWTVSIAMRRDVFDQRQAARHEAPIGRIVRARTAENSVVLAFERSGSLRYYAGRVTLRYDVLHSAWLDRAVAWLGARGVRVYAVLDERQAADAKQRFAGQQAAAAFARPLVVYQPAGTALFDLASPPAAGTQPLVIRDAFEDAAGCDPPVPLAPLAIR